MPRIAPAAPPGFSDYDPSRDQSQLTAPPPAPGALEPDDPLPLDPPPGRSQPVNAAAAPAPVRESGESSDDEEEPNAPHRGNRDVHLALDDQNSNRRGITSWASNRRPWAIEDKTAQAALPDLPPKADLPVDDDKLASGMNTKSRKSGSVSSMSVSASDSGSVGDVNSLASNSADDTDPGRGRDSSGPGRKALDGLAGFFGRLKIGAGHGFRQIRQPVGKAVKQADLYESPEQKAERLRRFAQEDEQRRQREKEFQDLSRDYGERVRRAEERGEEAPPEPERLRVARGLNEAHQRQHADMEAQEKARHARLRAEAEQHGRNAVQSEREYLRRRAEEQAHQKRPGGRGREAAAKKAERSQKAIAAQVQGWRNYSAQSEYDRQVRQYENRLQDATWRQLAAPPPRPQINPPTHAGIASPTGAGIGAATNSGIGAPPAAGIGASSNAGIGPQAGPSRLSRPPIQQLAAQTVAGEVSSFSMPAISLSGEVESTADLSQALRSLGGPQQPLPSPRTPESRSTLIAGVQANPGVNSATVSAVGHLPGGRGPEQITVTGYRNDNAGTLAARLSIPVSPPTFSPERAIGSRPTPPGITAEGHRPSTSNLPVLQSVEVGARGVDIQFSGQGGSRAQFVADRATLQGEESGVRIDLNPVREIAPPAPRRQLEGPEP